MTDVAVSEIQKAIADEKALFGIREVRKSMSQVKKVYLTSNCSAQVEADLSHYAKLSNINVEKLALSNEDLTILCKKPFLVNVVSILQ